MKTPNLPENFSNALSGIIGRLPGARAQQPFSERTQSMAAKNQGPAIAQPSACGNPMVRALISIQDSPEYEAIRSDLSPYGYYKGRFVIGEGSAVNGGIYVGTNPREEIAVDQAHGALPEVYRELKTRIGYMERNSSEGQILKEVFELVQERLKLNELVLNQMVTLNPHKALREKVSLDVFIHEEMGASRHQVLLAAWLIEKLKSEGILKGLAYIDHQTSGTNQPTEQLVYSSRKGTLLIFNPAEFANPRGKSQQSFAA